MKLEEAVRIASQITQALEAAHEQEIVHRDIKAQNVMLTKKGDAKVLDFGLALTAQSTKLTRMGSTLGTVTYMSPEQARGDEVDLRTDIWALGVTLYELIAGTHPFGGDYEQAVVYSILNEDPEPLTAIRTGVPLGLEWIISKCVAKKAKDRYQNCTDLLVDLRNVDLKSAGMSRVSTTSSLVTADVEKKDLLKFADSKSLFVGMGIGIMLISIALMLWPSGAPENTLRNLPIHLQGIAGVGLSPTLSSDKDHLFVRGEGPEGLGWYRFSFQSNDLQLLQNFDCTSAFRGISPDNSFLIFGGCTGEPTLIKKLPAGNAKVVSDSLRMAGWWTDRDLVLMDHGRKDMYLASISDAGDVINLSALNNDPPPRSGFLSGSIDPVDENRILYADEFSDGSAPQMKLFDRSKGTSVTVMDGGINGSFLAPDILIYQEHEGGELLAVRYDVDTNTTVSEPITIMEGWHWEQGGHISQASFVTSQPQSTLKKISITDTDGVLLRQYTVDASSGLYSLSPDGKKWTGRRRHSRNVAWGEIFYVDLDTGEEHVVDSSPGIKSSPNFSNDNSDILFFSVGLNSDTTRFQYHLTQRVKNEIQTDHTILLNVPSSTGRYSVSRKWATPGNATPLWLFNRESGEDIMIAENGNIPRMNAFSQDERFFTYRDLTDLQYKVYDIQRGIGYPYQGNIIRGFNPNNNSIYGWANNRAFEISYTTDPTFRLTEDIEVIARNRVLMNDSAFRPLDDGYVFVDPTHPTDYAVVWMLENFGEYLDANLN